MTQSLRRLRQGPKSGDAGMVGIATPQMLEKKGTPVYAWVLGSRGDMGENKDKAIGEVLLCPSGQQHEVALELRAGVSFACYHAAKAPRRNSDHNKGSFIAEKVSLARC